jgi:two-component system sensor histidine kinase CpxA
VTIAPVPFALDDLLPYWALISAGVAALFWLLAADVVRPLRRLSAAVTSFGRGDLTTRAPVARPDEIGHLAAAFNEMAGRLELLVTSERRLLQDVSHELRSPLTRLNLAIELLRNSPDPQPAIARLEREANRLSDLVATLLEVMRLEGDPAATPMTPLELLDVLDESAGDCGVEAATREVTIKVVDGTPAPMAGNRELLRRAFDNVISNAARYAPPRTTVFVSCRTTGGEHVIDVRDMGTGVLEDQLSKLGTPFYRTDESRNGNTGGVGLGLAIARRAVQVHGGTLELANADPGLQVTIRIPVER